MLKANKNFKKLRSDFNSFKNIIQRHIISRTFVNESN